MRQVLIQPFLSEKASSLESKGKYVFEVAPWANKVEIRRAIEDRYSVKVTGVHTITVKPRIRTRWTKKGFQQGKTKRRKKAIVTVAEGQTIDIVDALPDTNE